MSVRKLIFGRPGSGKTTLLTKEAVEALDDGIHVFSNVKINWFGKLFLRDRFSDFLNFLFSLFFRFLFFNRKQKIKKIQKRLFELQKKAENVVWTKNPEGEAIPDIDLTDIYFEEYNLKANLKKYQNYDKVIKEGLITDYYYPRQNFHFYEDLEQAINTILDFAEEFKDRRFLLAWDEGFVDLEHGAKVPRYITNFLNQTRKLQVDVTIASQRPVAVYPSYRALCDYMIRCQPKIFGRIEGRLYWIDTRSDALPDLSTRYDPDGHKIDESEHYSTFKAKKVFPFFSTRQSIALKRLYQDKR